MSRRKVVVIVSHSRVEPATTVQELTHLLVACQSKKPVGAAVPTDQVLPATSYIHTGVTEVEGATHDKHLAVESTRCRAVVIGYKRIGCQWRPSIGGGIVGREAVPCRSPSAQ